jgi:hypothetical protein
VQSVHQSHGATPSPTAACASGGGAVRINFRWKFPWGKFREVSWGKFPSGGGAGRRYGCALRASSAPRHARCALSDCAAAAPRDRSVRTALNAAAAAPVQRRAISRSSTRAAAAGASVGAGAVGAAVALGSASIYVRNATNTPCLLASLTRGGRGRERERGEQGERASPISPGEHVMRTCRCVGRADDRDRHVDPRPRSAGGSLPVGRLVRARRSVASCGARTVCAWAARTAGAWATRLGTAALDGCPAGRVAGADVPVARASPKVQVHQWRVEALVHGPCACCRRRQLRIRAGRGSCHGNCVGNAYGERVVAQT